MATSTTTNKARTNKAQATTTTTTTTQPTGTTTTTATSNVPQGQHPALVHLLATLPGVALANPTAAWPGYGKAVRLTGNAATVYVNRGNLDVRAGQGQVAAWANTVPGATVRGGAAANYLRLPFSSTGTSK